MMTLLKTLRRGTALLLLVLATTSTMWAQAPSTNAKIKSLIAVIKSATKDCGKLQDWTDIPAPASSYHDITFPKLADYLSKMLKEGRIKTAKLAGGAATCNFTDMDKDIIELDEDLLADMGSTDKKKAVRAKIQLLTGLMNEMIHVAQKINPATRCERERDSDLGSKKLMCRIVDALTKPDDTPHTTIAGLNGDAQAIPALATCLGLIGINPTTTDLAGVLAEARAKALRDKKFVSNRIDCFFNPIIANPADDWRDYYRNGGHRAGGAGAVKKVARAGADTEDVPGTSSRFFPNPVGQQTTQASGFTNLDGEMILVVATHGAAGDFALRFWRDVDGDLLPEPAPMGNVLIPGPFADPGLEGVSLYPTTLPGFGPMSLFVHDSIQGAMWWLPLDNAGLPAGPVQFLFSDPGLSFGAHEFLHAALEIQPGVGRFVFSPTPPVGQHELTPVVWFDFDLNTLLPSPSLNPGQFPAQAIPQELGWLPLAATGLVRLSGPPGASLFLDSAGQGNVQPLTQGVAGPEGLTTFLLPLPQLTTNDHLLITDGVDTVQRFYPRLGLDVDVATHDENGDGLPDQIDLTTTPPRLHYSESVPSAAAARQHVYEMILEDDDVNHIDSWDSNARRLALEDGVRDLILLPGSNPPLYVQSLHDLDGDGTADDSVIIRRETPAPSPEFVIEVILDVLTVPTPIQQIPLGHYEPLIYDINDLDGDGIPDLCVHGLDSFQDILWITGPGGLLVPSSPLYHGTADDLGQSLLVNGEGCGFAPVRSALPGDTLDLFFFSPGGTFDDALSSIVLGQLFPTGTTLNPVFPGLAVDLFQPSAPFLLYDSLTATPLGSLSDPLGMGTQLLLPVPPDPTLSGQSLMMQAIVLDQRAGNGIFASANGLEVRFD